MIFLEIITLLAMAFIGYLIGRWSDYYLNFWINDPYWTPHHWIYGLILIIIGTFYFNNYLGQWALFFGLGFLISDLKDFWEMKFFGKDNKTKETRKFWHID